MLSVEERDVLVRIIGLFWYRLRCVCAPRGWSLSSPACPKSLPVFCCRVYGVFGLEHRVLCLWHV